MKLRRYIPVKDGLEDAGVRMARFDDGAWVRAADVDALLARIREAGGEMIRHAEMYRAASCYAYAGRDNPALIADRERQERGYHATVAALDALLSGAETVHQCPPDGSGIMPCCGRTPFEVLADRMADDPALVTCKGRAS